MDFEKSVIKKTVFSRKNVQQKTTKNVSDVCPSRV